MPSEFDRLLPEIVLTSPMFTVITAKWADDTRSSRKNLQRDRVPLFQGELVEDLGGESFTYSIPLLFDGPACDLRAEQFALASKELGSWIVVHPTHGTLSLKLVEWSQNNAPVKSGGVVTVNTTWIDYIDPLLMLPTGALAGSVDAAIAALSAASAGAFAAGALANGFGDLGAILNAISIASAVANEVAADIYSASVNDDAADIAHEQADAANAEIAQATAAAQTSGFDGFDLETTATAIHTSMKAPMLAGPSPLLAISSMEGVVDDIISKLPSDTSYSSFNRCKTFEMTMEAALSAACLSATLAELQTRSQAIQAAQKLHDLFTSIVETMDAVSEQFESLPYLDDRYYAQTETYQAALDMVSTTIRYLLTTAFDLKIEKRITLDRDKPPIRIVMEEYGASGEDKLDEFIDLNNLEGDELVVVPHGKEIVLYVEGLK